MWQLWHHISSLPLSLSHSHIFSQGAGVMSVYLFMKRYAEEEMYRPHPALYRPRLSEGSDYSGQYLHPETWPPPQRARSASEISSDISIQLTQNPQHPPKTSGQQSTSSPGITAASSPTSGAGYQLPSSGSGAHFPHNHPLHPGAHGPAAASQTLPMSASPAAAPPPHYHTHMRMSASPC